jgi:hypothetical protein
MAAVLLANELDPTSFADWGRFAAMYAHVVSAHVPAISHDANLLQRAGGAGGANRAHMLLHDMAAGMGAFQRAGFLLITEVALGPAGADVRTAGVGASVPIGQRTLVSPPAIAADNNPGAANDRFGRADRSKRERQNDEQGQFGDKSPCFRKSG